MRTSLDLDPTVLREVRGRAAREGKSIGRMVSELLARALPTSGEDSAPPFTFA